jgi:dihydrofolate reductase
MGRVVLYIATSLDGAIARADQRIDWLFTGDDYGFSSFIAGVDALLMGRRTYESMLGFGGWPHGETPAWVMTHHAPAAVPQDWPVRFVGGSIDTILADLKRTRRGDIWLVGGGEVVAQALEADLVDRLVVSIHPLLIGPGRPLVAAPIPDRAFTLEKAEPFPDGLLQVSYRRAR